MEHAILGAGAIGGLVGTAVASLGEGVTVLVPPERLAGYPANLSVERPSGAIAARRKSQPRSQIRLTCSGSQPKPIN